MTEPTHGLDPLHELRRKNLLRVLSASNLKRSEFARKLDVSRSYLSQVLGEGFRFGEKAARSFEEKLRLKSGLLDEHENDGINVVEAWDRASDLPDGVYAMIPRIDLRGSGSQIKEMDLPPLAFRTDWLLKKGVASRSNLRTFDVLNDRMKPCLEVGDVVLIDMGQTEVINDEVYAIQYANELRIKRLARRFDGGLFIRSDNKAYPEESLSELEAKQIKIVGRMLWRGGGVG